MTSVGLDFNYRSYHMLGVTNVSTGKKAKRRKQAPEKTALEGNQVNNWDQPGLVPFPVFRPSASKRNGTRMGTLGSTPGAPSNTNMAPEPR